MKHLLSAALILLYISCTNDIGDYHVEAGVNHYINKDYARAQGELKKALDKQLISYSKKEVYTILGNVFNELYMFDTSIVYHKKALSIDSNYVDALVNLGVVYRLKSDYDSAEKYYLKAKRINPNDPELCASLGALNIFQGNIDLALENLKKSIDLDPELTVAYSNYALALAMNNEFELAEKYLKKAVMLGYENGDVLKERINNLREIQY